MDRYKEIVNYFQIKHDIWFDPQGESWVDAFFILSGFSPTKGQPTSLDYFFNHLRLNRRALELRRYIPKNRIRFAISKRDIV
jgi:hypothetical protein